MKLLSFATKHEGKPYPQAYIAMGRKVDTAFGYNGFYILIARRYAFIWRRVRGQGPLRFWMGTFFSRR